MLVGKGKGYEKGYWKGLSIPEMETNHLYRCVACLKKYNGNVHKRNEILKELRLRKEAQHD